MNSNYENQKFKQIKYLSNRESEKVKNSKTIIQNERNIDSDEENLGINLIRSFSLPTRPSQYSKVKHKEFASKLPEIDETLDDLDDELAPDQLNSSEEQTFFQKLFFQSKMKFSPIRSDFNNRNKPKHTQDSFLKPKPVQEFNASPENLKNNDHYHHLILNNINFNQSSNHTHQINKKFRFLYKFSFYKQYLVIRSNIFKIHKQQGDTWNVIFNVTPM